LFWIPGQARNDGKARESHSETQIFMPKVSNDLKIQLLGQGLFVVFLWSAAKIAMKMGLNTVSPYLLVAIIQVVATIVLIIRAKLRTKARKYNPSPNQLFIMILSGVVSYAAANLFVAIGLQYVTGSMAGLTASTTSVFGLFLAAIILQEKPKTLQYLGVAIVLLGAYIFLAADVIAGHWVGIGLLLVAEMAFAFGNVLSRLVAVNEKTDVASYVSLMGNVVGASVLVPIALLSGGAEMAMHLPGWVWILLVALGAVYAWSGVLWNRLLDKLKVVEVSVLANTMIVQVAILSVLFLGEQLTWTNMAGGVIVLMGAMTVDGVGFRPGKRVSG
jgi:drug/metabolite transporter (DMT)-like permease